LRTNTHPQDLSEAELWALDDKQRDEHFRQAERRRRAEFDRAKRTLRRVKLFPLLAATPGVAVTETAPVPTPAAAATTPPVPSSPSKEKGGRAATPAAGGASEKEAAGAANG